MLICVFYQTSSDSQLGIAHFDSMATILTLSLWRSRLPQSTRCPALLGLAVLRNDDAYADSTSCHCNACNLQLCIQCQLKCGACGMRLVGSEGLTNGDVVFTFLTAGGSAEPPVSSTATGKAVAVTAVHMANSHGQWPVSHGQQPNLHGSSDSCHLLRWWCWTSGSRRCRLRSCSGTRRA